MHTPLPLPTDATQRRIVDDVVAHGCHIIGIMENEHAPSVAYSVGLYHSFGHPEIIVTGLRPEVMFSMINEIRDRARAGTTFDVDALHDGLIDGLPCAARNIDAAGDGLLRFADWFYGGSPFPVRQCVWPDREGRFPWDDGYPHETLDTAQPMLWQSAG